MNARFAATLVAFAIATAVVSRAHVLPEFLIQVRDPNLLGGPLYAMLLKTFGFALVAAFCGILTGGTVLLVAWRTRKRGAPDLYAALAAVLVVLCMLGRLGVSLDPIGWICAAGFALMLERTDRASVANALLIVAAWALLQGGAPLVSLRSSIRDDSMTASETKPCLPSAQRYLVRCNCTPHRGIAMARTFCTSTHLLPERSAIPCGPEVCLFRQRASAQ